MKCSKRNSQASTSHLLALAEEDHAVVASPGGLARGANLGGLVSLVVETTVLAAGGGEATDLAVLVDRVDDPVDLGVTADGLEHGVDGDHLVPLEGGIHVHPVGVEDAQVTEALAEAGLRDGAVVLLQLHAEDTTGLGLTVGDTLVGRAFATTTANAHTEDAVTLLGLVAQHACLLGARGAAQTDNGVLVAELPRANTLNEAHHIGGLLLPQLVQIHKRAHFRA
ncbi:large subunit ribosomal protein L15e [Angomonas deanei]|nr:large subunit ribosomal protein L15e [Angomonas deanei]|eukprot:EPY42036.1 large subunit ribosomal protein L15e [Angomonas deanei]